MKIALIKPAMLKLFKNNRNTSASEIEIRFKYFQVRINISVIFFPILLSPSLWENWGGLFAQSNLWYLTRGLSTDEVAVAVDADNAGNIYWAVEEKMPPGSRFDIFLFKIDSSGQQIWQSVPYGGIYNDIAFIAKVGGNKVYLGGKQDNSTSSLDSTNAMVLCYNISDGSFNWDYFYDQGFGYEEIDGIMVQPDGIYLSGWTNASNDSMDFLIQKIDFSGQQVWSNTWGSNSWDGANGHMAMDDNYIYLAGSYNGKTIVWLPKDANMALACFSRTNGTYQWHVEWDTCLPSWPFYMGYDDALGMTMSSDSMLYVVGFSCGFGNVSQVYLRKYSRTGQLKWSKVWGGASTEDCRAAVADGDSIIYMAGTTGTYGNGAKDIFVLKYDSAGTLLDSLFWGGAYDEVAQDVVMFGDYLYITGQTKSFGIPQTSGDHTQSDALLLKINGRTMQAPDTLMTNVSDEEIAEEDIFVYPNPTSGEFIILLTTGNWQLASSQKQTAIIEIYNVLGRIVFQSEIKNPQSEIHLDLPSGIYFLQIKNDNFIQTKKLEVIK